MSTVKAVAFVVAAWLFAYLPAIFIGMMIRQAFFRIPWKWFFRVYAFLAVFGLFAMVFVRLQSLPD